jgi:iron complex outermembrane receptor protein
VDRDGAAVTRARRLAARPVVSSLWRATERVDLSAVAALPCLSTEAAGSPSHGCDALAPVGRLGAVARVSESWSVRGNVGRYVRFPTLAELYGFSAVVRGSPDLSVETGLSGDVGLRFAPRWRSSSWEAWADGFAFARWSSDLVAYRRSALGVVRPYNVGSARVVGAELSAVIRFLGLVENQIALTLLDPRDTTGRPGNDLLPFQARLVLADRLGVGWDVGRAALERATLGARLIHRASQYADQAGLVVIAAQTTVDLEASATWLDDRIAARVSVQNVADARQFDAVGFPLPGRAVYVGGELWWF